MRWKSWKTGNDNSGQVKLKARRLSDFQILSTMIEFPGKNRALSNMYSGIRN